MNEKLVRVNKFNKNIKELSVLERIGVDYPIYVRRKVAIKLAKVANKLPKKYKLQIDSGHRSLKIQQKIWKFRQGQNLEKIVFDPSRGVPPHSTGGAVDISLMNQKGKEINLSEPFKKFYDEPQLKSKKITPKAQKLRLLINKLMLEQNFAPNPKEHWHFSYGDRAWARYYKKKTFYKKIEIPKKQYFSLSRRILFKSLRMLRRIINKLLGKEVNY